MAQATDNWLEDEGHYEGQLAIDAYQTEDDVVVEAPIAGIKPEDLEIAITDEVITIKGQRGRSQSISEDNYFAQECYWGTFSRSFLLPVAVDPDAARAQLKDGILIVTIPKQSKSRARIVNVVAGE